MLRKIKRHQPVDNIEWEDCHASLTIEASNGWERESATAAQSAMGKGVDKNDSGKLKQLVLPALALPQALIMVFIPWQEFSPPKWLASVYDFLLNRNLQLICLAENAWVFDGAEYLYATAIIGSPVYAECLMAASQCDSPRRAGASHPSDLGIASDALDLALKRWHGW